MMEEDSNLSSDLLDSPILPDAQTLAVATASMSKSSSQASSVAGEMTGKLEEEDFLDDPSFVKVGYNGLPTGSDALVGDRSQDSSLSENTANRSSFSIIDGSSSFEAAGLSTESMSVPQVSTEAISEIIPPKEDLVHSELPVSSQPSQTEQGGSSLLSYFGMAAGGDDFLRSSQQSLPSPAQSIERPLEKPGNGSIPPTTIASENQSNSPQTMFPQSGPDSSSSDSVSHHFPSGEFPISTMTIPSTVQYPGPPSYPTQAGQNQPMTYAAPGGMMQHSMPAMYQPPPPLSQNQTNLFNPSQPGGLNVGGLTPKFEELKLNHENTTPTQSLTYPQPAPPSFPATPTQHPMSTALLQVSSSPMSSSIVQPHLSNPGSHMMLSGPGSFNSSGGPPDGIPRPFVPPVYSPTGKVSQPSPQIFVPQQPPAGSATFNTPGVMYPPTQQNNQIIPSPADGAFYPGGITHNIYNPAISPAMTQSQYDLDDDDSNEQFSGLWKWLKLTVNSDWTVNAHKFGKQLLQKTKIATDTVLTTLDPGMEEYLRPVINLAIDSRSQDVAQGLRQGFRSVFGHTVARGKDVYHDMPPLIIGLDNGMKALEQKFKQLSFVDFEFNGHYTMLACEVVVAELMPQQWYAMFLLGLRDAAHNINLTSLSQPIPVPSQCVQSILQYRDGYMTHHPTWDEIVYGFKQLAPNQDWCFVLTGIPKSAVLTLAAQCLASDYQLHLDSIPHKQEQIMTNFIS